MSTNALKNPRHKNLGETWYSYHAARIVQRHIQFGRHCRLDLDTLLVGVARRTRLAKLDRAATEYRRQPSWDSVDNLSLAQASYDFPPGFPDGAGTAASRVTETRQQTG